MLYFLCILAGIAIEAISAWVFKRYKISVILKNEVTVIETKAAALVAKAEALKKKLL